MAKPRALLRDGGSADAADPRRRGARSRTTRSAAVAPPMLSLDEALVVPCEPGSDLVALDDALTRIGGG